VTKALAKDPAERYQSAIELRNALQDVQQQTAAGRIVRGIVRTVARSRWTRRLALAAGLVALVAGGAWYLSAGPQKASVSFRTTKLTANVGVEQFPSLTPDGKWVLYAGEETGNRDIYLLSTSGQNPRNLTSDSPADDDEPAASPDGERIAFRSSRDGGGIFVMGLTGENPRRVAPGVSAAFNPAWSPDGTEIAYATENVQLNPLNWERKSELWVVNTSTDERRQIAVPDAVQPAWSPAGRRIAYVSRRRPDSSGETTGPTVGRLMDVYTVPARGGGPTPATYDQFNDWSPVWSPDGRHLYFVSDRGGSMNLWRVAIDEASGKKLGDPEPVTTGVPFLAHPSISGDGRRIAYSAVSKEMNIQQLALDPATGQPRGDPKGLTTGSRLWANPDPTPDGEWVVFYSQDQPEGDVWVIRSDRTGLRQLTRDEAVKDRVPRWSPDKAWVAFFSDRSGQLAVWKVRADASGLQQVSATGGVPVWSPDATRLATTEVLEFAGPVLVLDANRRWDQQEPQSPARPDKALQPFVPTDWSPDGSKLAGMIGFANRGGNPNMGVVVYTFATRTYERLTDFGEWPAWFGDSRRILFVNKGNEFWLYDTRTKQPQKIYSTTWDVLGPPRVTRDGRSVFFSRRVTEGDIYLLTFEE
jgi:Tol biopolymer transport system component